MKKVLAIIVSVTLFLMTVTGCSHPTEMDKGSKPPGESIAENPFESGENEMGILGSISHGPLELNLDVKSNRKPFVYDGGEIKLNYFANASGMAKNLGFLIFIDGKPQPYKVDDTNASYEYMHTFNLKKDNEDFPFSFIFSPVTGKKGDVLNLTIVSIYNPDFIPDMDKTISYGGYHSLLPATYQLELQTDAVPLSGISNAPISGSKQSEEAVTSKLMEELSQSGAREIDTELLNKEIFALLYFDGVSQMDNLNVKSNGNLHITYKLCGRAGLEYTTTFYANHKPVASSEGLSYDATISKGYASVIELDIALDKLDAFTTFYAVSVPKNANDHPDSVFEPQKTVSILVYKGE